MPAYENVQATVQHLLHCLERIPQCVLSSCDACCRIHVRRTDKVGAEAAFHSIDEYMSHVDDYYDTLEKHQHVGRRRVYIATDDPSVIDDAKRKSVSSSA